MDPTRSATPRRSPAWLIAALAAGPAAWSAQLILGYGVAGHACFPDHAPLTQSPPAGWSTEGAVLLAINIACLALALAAVTVSASRWRRGARQSASDRFLAICGVLSGLGFALAILFDTPVILAVPACWSIPS